jgi:hypothetical protein
MSYKDASAKQTQDYSDFNHFGAPQFPMGRSIVDPCFRPVSSGPKNGFDARRGAVVGRHPG